jgi:hypothetical protein
MPRVLTHAYRVYQRLMTIFSSLRQPQHRGNDVEDPNSHREIVRLTVTAVLGPSHKWQQVDQNPKLNGIMVPLAFFWL